MSFELERIEELCQERGWSHYRLAIEMDTSPNNIGNLFRRTTVPSIPTIRRICEVMGITIAQFYSTDGVQVTLNGQQARILDLYDKLDQTDKARPSLTWKVCRPGTRTVNTGYAIQKTACSILSLHEQKALFGTDGLFRCLPEGAFMIPPGRRSAGGIIIR